MVSIMDGEAAEQERVEELFYGRPLPVWYIPQLPKYKASYKATKMPIKMTPTTKTKTPTTPPKSKTKALTWSTPKDKGKAVDMKPAGEVMTDDSSR